MIKRQKNNKKHKNKIRSIYLILFFIFLCTSPLSKFSILKNVNINDESYNRFNTADIPPDVEAFYDYIKDVDVQIGQDYVDEGNINDLEDLKSIDGNKYELIDAWVSEESLWKIITEITFGADLDTYPLDYYDVFLFLEIDAPTNPDAIVELEAYSEYAWQKICDIGEEGVSYNGLLLERTTKFRLLSSTTPSQTDAYGQNIIKIEQMKLVIGHEGNFDSIFSSSVNYVDTFHSYSPDNNPNFPETTQDDWWETGDGKIAQIGSTSVAHWSSSSYSTSVFHLFFNFDFSGGEITDVTNVQNLGLIATVCTAAYPIPQALTSNMYLIDMVDNSLDHHKQIVLGNGAPYAFLQNWASEFMANWQKYLHINKNPTDPDYGKGHFGIISMAYAQGSCIFLFSPVVTTETWQLFEWAGGYMEFKGYGFDNYDYPEFIQINQTSNYRFKIDEVLGKYQSSVIDSVEYMLQNDENYYDWEEINPDSNENFIFELESSDYNPGIYNLWIKATDNNGYSTFELFSPIEF